MDGFSKSLEGLLSAMETERRNHEKDMAAYVKDQTDKYNALNKRKLELEDEAAMRRKKIETLEGDIDELKKRLDEEIKKQKLSADRLM